jgi:hypothetical protein
MPAPRIGVSNLSIATGRTRGLTKPQNNPPTPKGLNLSQKA